MSAQYREGLTETARGSNAPDENERPSDLSGRAGGRVSPSDELLRHGSRLKERRTTIGVTQVQLAELAGLTSVTISRVERGSSPTFQTMLRIGKALDLAENVRLPGFSGFTAVTCAGCECSGNVLRGWAYRCPICSEHNEMPVGQVRWPLQRPTFGPTERQIALAVAQLEEKK